MLLVYHCEKPFLYDWYCIYDICDPKNMKRTYTYTFTIILHVFIIKNVSEYNNTCMVVLRNKNVLYYKHVIYGKTFPNIYIYIYNSYVLLIKIVVTYFIRNMYTSIT
jgi:hypothetical protein